MGTCFKEAHGGPFARICGARDHVVPAESYSESDDREKRLREISLLQQRACALETELKCRNELEEALRHARERAEAASTAKDEFLAMLGHELRNPLSPILTALELMKLRGDGRILREQEVIERQTRHLIRLVDDLLDVSRITRGKVELRKEAVEVRDVLAKATEIASPLLEQRRHHFDVQAPPRGVRLQADEARLAQVVANLLTNAAKYTEPGGHISLDGRRAAGSLRRRRAGAFWSSTTTTMHGCCSPTSSSARATKSSRRTAVPRPWRWWSSSCPTWPCWTSVYRPWTDTSSARGSARSLA